MIKTVIERSCKGIEYYISHDISKTMNEFNNNLLKGEND